MLLVYLHWLMFVAHIVPVDVVATAVHRVVVHPGKCAILNRAGKLANFTSIL